jgi:hypothetical protein
LARRFVPTPRPTLESKWCSSLRSVSLQHFQIKAPFSALNLWLSVQELLHSFLEVPPSGFGYPLDGVSSFEPWRSFSTSHALGICPSELFSDLKVQICFRISDPLLRFISRPYGLRKFASAAFSFKTSRTLLRLSGFSTQVGPCALLSFRTFRVSLRWPNEEAPSFSVTLSFFLQRPPKRVLH